MCVCARCPAMDWHAIWGEFSHQSSPGFDPGQVKLQMNECFYQQQSLCTEFIRANTADQGGGWKEKTSRHRGNETWLLRNSDLHCAGTVAITGNDRSLTHSMRRCTAVLAITVTGCSWHKHTDSWQRAVRACWALDHRRGRLTLMDKATLLIAICHCDG